MTSRLRELPEPALRALADALAAGKLRPPWHGDALVRLVGGPPWLEAELGVLTGSGLDPGEIAWGLRLLCEERSAWRERWEGVELTWTGPAELATETRDTGAVVRQLLSSASRSLLVATYALDDGKGDALLGVLRQRMEAIPSLKVRFFLNLPRQHGDHRDARLILEEHDRRLRQRVFAWQRQPEIFYDRRALASGPGPKACLHAKVVVQDEHRTLVTSANLTEAAQERNIEAGVLVSDSAFARQVTDQFEKLIAAEVLLPLNPVPRSPR